eukprot:4581395-Amphidinium_carterae.1
MEIDQIYGFKGKKGKKGKGNSKGPPVKGKSKGKGKGHKGKKGQYQVQQWDQNHQVSYQQNQTQKGKQGGKGKA